MGTLYEMTHIAHTLYELFENEEIDEKTLQDTLEGIGIEGKLEDYCKVIRQFEADAFTYKTEKLRLAEKQKRAENSVERLKNAIITYLSVCGKTKEKAGSFNIGLRKNASVVIDDLLKIDDSYLRYSAPEPNKDAIKRAIKDGIVIEGAHIEENYSVNIK
jgi:hypothetical protein